MSTRQSWHIPLHQGELSLREALASIPPHGKSEKVSLMLRLQHDPDLSFLGQLVFRAGMDQQQHDCIHIMLGRGFLSLDQAFVLGFTIGCSKKVSVPEHKLNGDLGRHFYRNVSFLNESEAAVFKEGVRLAYISCCSPLENFDFMPWHDQNLRDLRGAAGVETELLQAYYAVEKHRYPHATDSQRLLPNPARVSGI